MAAKQADSFKQLRRQAGKWLKTRRKQAELTQKDLAKQLNLEYYTFISQIESGHGRVPSSLYRQWAQALGLASPEFALKMIEFYDPHTFEALGYETTEPLAAALLER